MRLGEEIRKARVSAKISQKRLAMDLGVSQSFVCEFERGYRPFPAERLARLPDEIRPAVVDAMIQALERQALALRPLLTVGPK